MTKQYTCIPLFIFKENNRTMVNWLHLVVVYPMGPFLEKGKISLTKLILQQGGTYSGLNLVLNIDMLIGSYNLEFFFYTNIWECFYNEARKTKKIGKRRQNRQNFKWVYQSFNDWTYFKTNSR